MEVEREERRRKERDIIRSSLAEGSAAMLTKFFFVDFQSLCEISNKPPAKYQPCEVALVEFTLHSGIGRSFHRFVDPGESCRPLSLSPPPLLRAHVTMATDVD